MWFRPGPRAGATSSAVTRSARAMLRRPRRRRFAFRVVLLIHSGFFPERLALVEELKRAFHQGDVIARCRAAPDLTFPEDPEHPDPVDPDPGVEKPLDQAGDGVIS